MPLCTGLDDNMLSLAHAMPQSCPGELESGPGALFPVPCTQGSRMGWGSRKAHLWHSRAAFHNVTITVVSSPPGRPQQSTTMGLATRWEDGPFQNRS